jgi:hypothetical protein
MYETSIYRLGGEKGHQTQPYCFRDHKRCRNICLGYHVSREDVYRDDSGAEFGLARSDLVPRSRLD